MTKLKPTRYCRQSPSPRVSSAASPRAVNLAVAGFNHEQRVLGDQSSFLREAKITAAIGRNLGIRFAASHEKVVEKLKNNEEEGIQVHCETLNQSEGGSFASIKCISTSMYRCYKKM